MRGAQAAPLRVLVVPDKFKGTLTAIEVARSIGAGIVEVRPEARIELLPLADGGEGTLDVALLAGLEMRHVIARGPTGVTRPTCYAVGPNGALVELAEVCGLAHLPSGVPDPLGAHTAGLGDVVRAALDEGVRRVTVTLGGSASTDAGLGLLTALGVRAVDRRGAGVPPGARHLHEIVDLDLSGLSPAAAAAEFVVATDVTNPLLGPQGSVAVFAAQKSMRRDDEPVVERGLRAFAAAAERATGRSVGDLPGGGAAGGVAAGMVAVLGARLESGAELVAGLLDLGTRIQDADVVVTGEGSFDAQSLAGKGPHHVMALARETARPCHVVAGRIRLSASQMSALALAGAWSLEEVGGSTGAAMRSAAPLLVEVGRRLGRGL